ncbi:hypothetical protein BKA62DRAFT_792380 [Auriculariales sp. MPI-PUGE-AT-0066]|nr:hypothetical protein BKA62DRAFT_792380 [Auriculariales sp. MPI-PUGE-AT-0066]
MATSSPCLLDLPQLQKVSNKYCHAYLFYLGEFNEQRKAAVQVCCEVLKREVSVGHANNLHTLERRPVSSLTQHSVHEPSTIVANYDGPHAALREQYRSIAWSTRTTTTTTSGRTCGTPNSINGEQAADQHSQSQLAQFAILARAVVHRCKQTRWDFNPHNDKRAADQAYRISQKVTKLISKGTIEEVFMLTILVRGTHAAELLPAKRSGRSQAQPRGNGDEEGGKCTAGRERRREANQGEPRGLDQALACARRRAKDGSPGYQGRLGQPSVHAQHPAQKREQAPAR